MRFLFLLLLAAALVYHFLALLASWRFFRRSLPSPSRPPFPGVTVFKPLKGVDPDSRETLTTFLIQDYEPYQVLFGVADPHDPVVPLLEELQRSYPRAQAETIICPLDLGLNPKVSTLRQLEPHARYDLLVVADGDVAVGTEFLSRVAAALEEPGAGLVSCPYRAGPADTLGAKLEALSISADFIPSVAMAFSVEGIQFALGATMALPRGVLDRIGGFAALADFLADDYQLGWRVAQTGLRVEIIPYVVETRNPSLSLREYLAHQLRWSRTYRVCRPKGYLAFGITHALVFSLVYWVLSGFSGLGFGLILATLAIRGVLAIFSEKVCLKGMLPTGAFLLLPLKDLLSFGLWLLSFLGNRVVWQTRRYRVTPAGQLVPE